MPPPALADFAVVAVVYADDVVDASAAVASAPVAPRAQTTSSARLDKRTLTTSLLVIAVLPTTRSDLANDHTFATITQGAYTPSQPSCEWSLVVGARLAAWS